MGRSKRVSKKRKRSSNAGNEKEAISNTATCSTLVVDDGLVSDILSRLPAKSLMRFKCVSKNWLSLIKDPYFINLHSRTPKTAAHLLFLIPPPQRGRPKNKTAGISYQEVCFKTAALSSEVTGRTTSTMYTTSKSFECLDFLGPVNGLICFTKKFEVSVCIFNISTREVMPLAKSTFRDINDSLIYGFGHDPATKHYKVICNWRVSTKNGNQFSVGHFWEVLTLGTNSWKGIEDVPPLPDRLTSSSIYVNGSIYWFPKGVSERQLETWYYCVHNGIGISL